PSGSTTELTQYAISGLDFKPQRVWLDAKGETAAILSPWFSIIPSQSEPAIAELQKEQQKAENGWSEWVAREVTRVPQVDVLIRNARLFDPRDLSVTPGTSVLIRRDRIIKVAPDPD